MRRPARFDRMEPPGAYVVVAPPRRPDQIFSQRYRPRRRTGGRGGSGGAAHGSFVRSVASRRIGAHGMTHGNLPSRPAPSAHQREGFVNAAWARNRQSFRRLESEGRGSSPLRNSSPDSSRRCDSRHVLRDCISVGIERSLRSLRWPDLAEGRLRLDRL
jgi:hypothetical protein